MNDAFIVFKVAEGATIRDAEAKLSAFPPYVAQGGDDPTVSYYSMLGRLMADAIRLADDERSTPIIEDAQHSLRTLLYSAAQEQGMQPVLDIGEQVLDE